MRIVDACQLLHALVLYAINKTFWPNCFINPNQLIEYEFMDWSTVAIFESNEMYTMLSQKSECRIEKYLIKNYVLYRPTFVTNM